jgi:hypothetical protein
MKDSYAKMKQSILVIDLFQYSVMSIELAYAEDMLSGLDSVLFPNFIWVKGSIKA